MWTASIKLRVSLLCSLRESRPANKDISVTLHSFCLQTFSSDSEIQISTLQRLRGELRPKAVGKILTLGKHLEPVHSLTRGHWVLSGGFPYCSCNNAAAFLQATATHTHTQLPIESQWQIWKPSLLWVAQNGCQYTSGGCRAVVCKTGSAGGGVSGVGVNIYDLQPVITSHARDHPLRRGMDFLL